ncbi:MAG: phage tail tube protein [Pelagibacteraceae bacterium]
MAVCSQFAAAFGFQLLISPVSACGIDLGTVSGGLKAGGFLDPSSTLSDALRVEEGVDPSQILVGDPGTNVVYDNDTNLTQSVFTLTGLTNAGLETDTGSESIITYDTEGRGFDQSVAISKSWTISVEGVTRFDSTGYKVLRLLEANAVSGQLKCKVARIGPNGTTEAIYGYATVTNFSESIESGSIITFSCELQGYGPLALDLDNNNTINVVGPINTLSLLDAGTNLLDGSYTDVALTGGNGNGLATADITVSGGVVVSSALVDAGDNYQELDTLSANLLGATIFGVLDTVSVAGSGINLLDGSYTGLTLSGGTGTQATADVTVSGNGVTGLSIANAGSGYAINDTLAIDGIGGAPNPDLGATLALTSLVGGSNYLDGTFSSVAVTGGSGSGLLLNLTVTGGVVSLAQIADGGAGYQATDVLTYGLDPAVIPGTGEALTISTTDAGEGLTDGTYIAEPAIGGSGTGLLLDLTVESGVVTEVVINDGGSGYLATEVVTVGLTGTTAAEFVIDTVDEDVNATPTAWSVTISAVDENANLVPTAATVTVDTLTTEQAVHTDPTFRVTSLVGNDETDN